jgi:hypothetical protein
MPVALVAAAATAYGAYQSGQNADKARKEARRGGAQANALLEQGLAEARPELEKGYDEANAFLDPYAKSGSQSQKIYDDLMGLNGEEARAQAQSIITSDPLWTGKLAQDLKSSGRLLNARGFDNSGANALASARVLNENYQPVLNRYQQGGAQGATVAGAQADLARGRGTDIAGLINTTRGNQANAAMGQAANQVAGINAGAQGTNNALALGISAMTPNNSGQSAASSFVNGLSQTFGAGASNPAASTSYTASTPYGNPTGSSYNGYNFFSY